jgi:ribosomal-protein-alanine N-acetyltransferase
VAPGRGLKDETVIAGDFPQLETPRLRLREIAAADAPALLRIHGDPVVMRWFGNEPVADLAAAQRVVENFAGLRFLQSPGIRWAIEPKAAAGALAGTCGFFRWNRGWRTCMLGYELDRPAQGRGYMREALRAVLPWAFEALGIARVEAQVHPDNAASFATLEAVGFRREGLQRAAAAWSGTRHDMVMMGLLREELRAAG